MTQDGDRLDRVEAVLEQIAQASAVASAEKVSLTKAARQQLADRRRIAALNRQAWQAEIRQISEYLGNGRSST